MNQLFDALTSLASMQTPSVVNLLRSQGYTYEAEVVQRVVDACRAFPVDADEVGTAAPMSYPIRVYYKTREPFLVSEDASLEPVDFEAIVVLNDLAISSDGQGQPYVFEVTPDEQIDVLYVGESISDCAAWMARPAPADQVFERLNQDERPGGQSFRSMSVGDVVEINGVMQQCLSFGWRMIMPDRAKALRQHFGLRPNIALPRVKVTDDAPPTSE